MVQNNQIYTFSVPVVYCLLLGKPIQNGKLHILLYILNMRKKIVIKFSSNFSFQFSAISFAVYRSTIETINDNTSSGSEYQWRRSHKMIWLQKK